MTDFQVTDVPGTGADLALDTPAECTGVPFMICQMLANRRNLTADYDSNHRARGRVVWYATTLSMTSPRRLHISFMRKHFCRSSTFITKFNLDSVEVLAKVFPAAISLALLRLPRLL